MSSSFVVIGVIVLCVIVVGVHRIQTASRAISFVSTSAAPSDAIRAWLVTSLSPALRKHGYRLMSQSDRQLDFVQTYRPALVWLVTVATFPVGLIVFALFPQRRILTAFLRDADDGARQVVFSGEAPNHLANRLATIADQS